MQNHNEEKKLIKLFFQKKNCKPWHSRINHQRQKHIIHVEIQHWIT